MRKTTSPAKPKRGASRHQVASDVKPVKKRVRRGAFLKNIPWPLLCVVLFVSGFGYGSFTLSRLFVDYLDQPIQNVVILGDTENLNADQLTHRVMLEGQAGFVSTDMEQVREIAESFGWVRTVKIRRFWPYGVELNIDEHVPVARWGNGSLLSNEGEVYPVANTARFTSLPNLFGNEGQELELMATYSELSRQLAPVGLSIESLTRSSRGAWQLILRNELKLELGREQVSQKISNFVSVYKLTLHKQIEQIEQVDLRYTNGLAVSWKAREQKI
jgi:cell division protein FtsQ